MAFTRDGIWFTGFTAPGVVDVRSRPDNARVRAPGLAVDRGRRVLERRGEFSVVVLELEDSDACDVQPAFRVTADVAKLDGSA